MGKIKASRHCIANEGMGEPRQLKEKIKCSHCLYLIKINIRNM